MYIVPNMRCSYYKQRLSKYYKTSNNKLSNRNTKYTADKVLKASRPALWCMLMWAWSISHKYIHSSCNYHRMKFVVINCLPALLSTDMCTCIYNIICFDCKFSLSCMCKLAKNSNVHNKCYMYMSCWIWSNQGCALSWQFPFCRCHVVEF